MAGPLDGVRVVEMDAIGPVPLAAMILSDLGASVLRIERPGGQSAYEGLGEAIVHRGRHHLELDLKSAAGRAIALDLVAGSDALLEGFRPGVMEKLGLGPDICRDRNGRLVYARMTGWGQDGPLSRTAGHDINYVALTGALAAIGEPGRVPPPPLNLVGDYGGGAMFCVTGVLAGLLKARETGRGDVVDVAMTDGVGILMSMFLAMSQGGHWREDARGDNLLDGGAPFYRAYECADGRHVAVGAIEPQFFAALLAGLGIDPATVRQNDRAAWPALAAALANRFRSRPRDSWTEIFRGSDACVTPVLTMGEAVASEANRARDAHPRSGGLHHPAPAPRFRDAPGRIHPSRRVDAGEALALFGEQG